MAAPSLLDAIPEPVSAAFEFPRAVNPILLGLYDTMICACSPPHFLRARHKALGLV
jgi:hypothetical protein